LSEEFHQGHREKETYTEGGTKNRSCTENWEGEIRQRPDGVEKHGDQKRHPGRKGKETIKNVGAGKIERKRGGGGARLTSRVHTHTAIRLLPQNENSGRLATEKEEGPTQRDLHLASESLSLMEVGGGEETARPRHTPAGPSGPDEEKESTGAKESTTLLSGRNLGDAEGGSRQDLHLRLVLYQR